MKVYKDKQFLVFDFEDGQTVKYDFATKTAIGKKGKPVKDLCSQLSGLTIDDICNCCSDDRYGKFLRFVKYNSGVRGREIRNIGTILNRVVEFSHFEQIFSAGIDDIIDRNFRYSINDIPKGLLKLCRTHQIRLSNNFLKFYNKNPDAYLLAYNLEYVSLNDHDVYSILMCTTSVRVNYTNQWGYDSYRYEDVSTFNMLINDYGYTGKSLLLYLDRLKTYEAIDNMISALRELYDYASMMQKISHKFDKYPKNFLTTHKIACRNYNRLKQQFAELDFKNRIDESMEKTFDEYCFIYPKCTQDIKDEAAQQSNCVASYIQRVIDGQCHILFLRHKDRLDKSLVTIEVRNNKIVQALRHFNEPLLEKEREVVDKWNVWREKYIKGIESEEMKDAC